MKEKTFKQKLSDLLSSTRFWMLTGTAIIMILNLYAANPILGIVRDWLLGLVGIGTLDSVATKLRGK